MIFRIATVDDIDAYMVVRMAVKENVLNNPALVTRKDNEEYLTNFGKGWVCEIENQIVGFAIVGLKQHSVWALFVHPDFEGKGIGKKLHDIMMDWYFNQTKEKVWLSTSPNTKAEKFYKKAGWTLAGDYGKNEVKFEMTYQDWIILKSKTMDNNYLESVLKQFEYYKSLGEKTFAQLTDEQLFLQYNEECNSIATIVKHLSGNMLSRWTDFLTTDGEKEWRTRDAEFENDIKTRAALLQIWNEGWQCVFNAIKSLNETDLLKTIYIRAEAHTVTEAINRQLAHYPYHVGQIVFIGKMFCNENWTSLSIPKKRSFK